VEEMRKMCTKFGLGENLVVWGVDRKILFKWILEYRRLMDYTLSVWVDFNGGVLWNWHWTRILSKSGEFILQLCNETWGNLVSTAWYLTVCQL
jgi:hypothetical protein